MDDDARPRGGRPENRLRWHLHMVRARRIEGAVSASPLVGDDDLRRLRSPPRRLLDARCDVGWDPLDLAGIEQRERPQRRDPLAARFIVATVACAIVDIEAF